jgi:surfeit locus 1 family protein
VVLLAAMLGVLVTASLGMWQLNRAAQKEAIAAQILSRDQQATLENTDLSASKGKAVEQLHYRRAQLKGQWLNQHTVFLDNRQMQARVGFFVLTPFKLSGSQDVLLVQRGWVQRRFNDRNALPLVLADESEQTIALRMSPPPAKLYQIKGEDTGKIRQNVNLTSFATELNLPLLPLSAQQLEEGTSKDGLLRDWPRVNTGVEKHYGYAFQWFGLAALIALLTVWFQLIKPGKTRLAS